MSELESGDKRSAYIGMFVTSVLLFLLAFTIVKLTNAKYAGGESHAETTK
jgi:hypothetical protein